MRTTAAAAYLFISTGAIAQSYTDISVVALGTDTLEVRLLRPYDTADSLLSLTFTLAWDTTGNVHLDVPDQFFSGLPFCEFYALPLSASPDGEVDVNGLRYQTYNAVGTATLPGSCDALLANVEYAVVRIPVISSGACVNINVVNDAYTAANNKDYFFSSGGINTTGVVTGTGALDMGNCTTGVNGSPRTALPAVWPNPASDRLNLNTNNEELLGWRLVDASGREAAAANTSGSTQATVDIATLPAGAYSVELRTRAGVSRHHVVIAR